MIKYAVQQWDKNKGKLEQDIRENIDEYKDFSYGCLVRKMVEFILNDEDSEYSDLEFDTENITQIDNGDYQGTLMYIIPKKTYQPSNSDYLMTYVYYGSCSGCDTLRAIQYDGYFWLDEEDIKELDKETVDYKINKTVKDLMQLCLNLIQNLIKPYNHGWDADEDFNIIEEKTN